MKSFLGCGLIKEALEKLARTDYLAKSILDYSEEALKTGNRNTQTTGMAYMFANDVKDLKSEDEFLDLKPMIDMVTNSVKENNSNFEWYCMDYVLGIKKFDRREDKKGYGTI